MNQPLELSIVIPCLNEARSLPICLKKAFQFLEDAKVSGQVIVADNGSTDGSREIVLATPAKLVDVPHRGYGCALRAGIASAESRFVVMGDADDSYNFLELGPLLEKLREGADLVMGNRFAGKVMPGAMPPIHYYFGNPLLSKLAQIFFRAPIGDVYCGLRGFRTEFVQGLSLRSDGMEYAIEMIAKASLFRAKIAEVPITLYPDARGRKSHLRTWRDGWRTLRFMLLYSPNWLFLYPGIFCVLFGSLLGGLLANGPIHLGRIGLSVHSMLYCAFLVVLGVQTLWLWVSIKLFSIREGFLPRDPLLEKVHRVFYLETGLILGLFLILFGVVATIRAFWSWNAVGFGELDPYVTFRTIIPAIVSLFIGFQTVFSSFFLSAFQFGSLNEEYRRPEHDRASDAV